MEDKTLERLRAQIDVIDDQLLAHFAERMRVVAEIAACKRDRKLPIFAPEREREILARIRAQAGEELGGYAETLFRELLTLSRAHLERLAAEEKPGKEEHPEEERASRT